MNKIICGDALATLKTLESGIVQTCCTSPPYYSLRDYNCEGQIGLEESPEAYIARLVEVFREVKRVLRDDGTLWVNIGDSYWNSTFIREKAGDGWANKGDGDAYDKYYASNGGGVDGGKRRSIKHRELKEKDLIGIPWLLAFALRADGWYLRSDIIWAKSNCMPESVTDRPTKAHEYIFLLSKSANYFYDAESIKEPSEANEASQERARYKGYDAGHAKHREKGEGNGKVDFLSTQRERYWPTTRNKRSVWTVSTMPFSGAHFAVFPPKLIEPCILADSSARACEICGSPYERIIEHTPMLIRNGPKAGGYGSRTTDALSGTMMTPAETHTTGWQPTCTHDNTGSGSCIVLDPFAGAGTVPLVSIQHHRAYIGIELNPEYVKLIQERIETVQPVLWEVPA